MLISMTSFMLLFSVSAGEGIVVSIEGILVVSADVDIGSHSCCCWC
jgi:hypothetical protein